jgi:lysophospholipase L1-like esterase
MNSLWSKIFSRHQFFMMLILAGGAFQAAGQEAKVDTSYANEYYLNKRDLQEAIPVHSWNIVFLGNSITERGLWSELFPAVPVLNRGIGGDNCWGVYARLDSILTGKPASIYLLIGINDLGRGLPVKLIAMKYEQIIRKIRKDSPGTRLFLQTVLPINETTIRYEYMKGKTAGILTLNDHIRELASKYDLPLLDLFSAFADGQKQLPASLCVDGLHLNGVGYSQWKEFYLQCGIF